MDNYTTTRLATMNKKRMKVAMSIAVTLLILACSSSGKSEKIEEAKNQTEISELELLLNKYVDNNTEVTLKKNTLIIFQQERIPKRRATINMTDITGIEYNFVDGNPGWPHQIIIEGDSDGSIKVELYYVNQDKPKLDTDKFEVLTFSNKKASLRALDILNSICTLNK